METVTIVKASVKMIKAAENFFMIFLLFKITLQPSDSGAISSGNKLKTTDRRTMRVANVSIVRFNFPERIGHPQAALFFLSRK